MARADEGGISFWVPGLYGSLAAVPQQAPGWSATTIYWHDSVSAGADVARAREITIGNIPANVTATANANVHANLDIGFLIANYAFETPVFGGQASAGFLAAYGANSTSLAGTLTGTETGPGGGTFPFSRSDSISSSIMGFGDIYPQFALRWNAGVHNYMTYITGDMPVGAYDSSRLANIGSGTGRSTPAAATPISTQRPGMKLRRCSDSPTTSSILLPNIRAASTCTSTGARRNS